MNVLVTGGCGQLGMSLRRVMADAIFTDVVDAPDTVLLDITDLAAVRSMVASEGVDVIVNCAGYTNVDAAESHADAAELLNAKAVENLAVAMKEVGGLLVHMSTDYVFGSKYNTPIPEDAVTAPESVYGQSKWHGEEAIRRVGCRSVIIRTAWLYSEFGKNFVKTMLRLTAEKPSLKVVFDQVGTPTYAGDLAQAIVSLLEIAGQAGNADIRHAQAEGDVRHARPDRASQTFHFTNEGVCSWYDFAKTIAEYAGHTACDIQPCHSDEFPSPVRRPAYSVLDKTKIKETFGLRIPYWTDSLKKCLKNLIAG